MFRFTIRDVLWLMVVVAVVCAWITSARYREKRFQQELRVIEDEYRDVRHYLNPK